MSKPSHLLQQRSSAWFSLCTRLKRLDWLQRLLGMAVVVSALSGGALWVNYQCCYWPFKYDPFPKPQHEAGKGLKQRVAQIAYVVRTHIPDIGTDAASLSALAERGSVVRMDMSYLLWGRGLTTNKYGGDVARCLFSRTNRIDRAAPKNFWTKTPYHVSLYTTNGPVSAPILYDAPRGIWRFGNYFFSLRGPTNFNAWLNPAFGGVWEWPTPSSWTGL